MCSAPRAEGVGDVDFLDVHVEQVGQQDHVLR